MVDIINQHHNQRNNRGQNKNFFDNGEFDIDRNSRFNRSNNENFSNNSGNSGNSFSRPTTFKDTKIYDV